MQRKEDYIKNYMESAKHLGIEIETPVQQIMKTAEAAFAVGSYPVEPSDQPAERSPHRRNR